LRNLFIDDREQLRDVDRFMDSKHGKGAAVEVIEHDRAERAVEAEAAARQRADDIAADRQRRQEAAEAEARRLAAVDLRYASSADLAAFEDAHNLPRSSRR
jgi:hypothetical protein